MSDDIEFRKAAAVDRDAILALRAIAFPGDDPEKQRPDFWRWEFETAYAGPGHVFIAESGNRIVGHFAFVPQRYVAGDKPLRGALAVDVMTHPDFRRQRVFSRLAAFAASRLRDEFQVVTAFQIRDAVMAGMQAGGWKFVQQNPVLLKPLSIPRIAHDMLRGSRTVPAISRAPFRLDGVDELLATDAIRQPRTADFLSWRYAMNPDWRYSAETSFDGDRPRAFIVHRDTVLRGLRSVAIADAGGDAESIRPLLRRVCAAARARGMAVAAALISRSHPAYPAMRRSGFYPGPHRFNLLLQVFDDSLRFLYDAPWSLSWGDTDHL
jgi:GNAT superfamily N-acetyltransferase